MSFVVNMDFSNIEPNQGGRSYLPVSDSRGWLVQITESNTQENKNKDGMVAKFIVMGMEGAAQGRTTDHYVNLSNPSQKATEIGHGELSAIAHCTGHLRVGNSQEWHNRPLRAVVVADPSDQSPNATKIQKWLTANGDAPKAPGQAPQNAGNFGGGAPQQQQPVQQQPQNGGGNWGGGAPANTGGAPATGQAPQGGGFQPQNGGAPANAGGGFQPAGNGFQPQGGGAPQGGGFQPGQGAGGPGWGNT